MSQPIPAQEVTRICKLLQAEPLFHMSLGSKELFHSNFIAWFADGFPQQAAAAFATWSDSSKGTLGRQTDREPGHLDLILNLPDLMPIALENKVFSVPDKTQLDRYAEGALKQRDALGVKHSRILLSLMSPGWKEATYNGWQCRTYGDLADALAVQIRAVQVVDRFSAELLQHYVQFIRLLTSLVELLGTPDPNAPLLLPAPVVRELDLIRISAGIQKARASHVAYSLAASAEARWPDVKVGHGFSNGTSLIEAFRQMPGGGSGELRGDAIGWQLQGTQFRLYVETFQQALVNPGHRPEREAYVLDRYGPWFDFGLLEEVSAVATARTSEVRGDKWSFQGYNPGFVYRYRDAPNLSPAQIYRIGIAYLDLAAQIGPDVT